MSTWCEMTVAEQALLRRAMTEHILAGMVQYYGAALRWAEDAGAPPARAAIPSRRSGSWSPGWPRWLWSWPGGA
ncbi:hypothetical protein J2Z21_003273 [Streptomyces griseochromogenes]|uniref:Uncharacterized protein n=1 Tax=Streptomyces griseochromogenes TaxID=68214 RepID=A0A1B1B8S7_9ACTN|nr:hypothetical protein [Streptomyces griseochromogenes]ANP55225.1 hypothetical protein AVL59_41560 [Streptomyces griseochromogenes]MBP2050334.1 hypothetical protein [Streptomyces griseochromogenes]